MKTKLKTSMAALIVFALLFSFTPSTVYAAPKAGTPKVNSVSIETATSMMVKWGKVSKASGYEVYRSTSLKGKYTKVYTGKKLVFTDKTVKKNRTYFYKVRAYILKSGKRTNGKFSPVASMKLLVAKPSFTVIPKSDSELEVRWKRYPGATGYQLGWSETETGKYKVVNLGNVLSYMHTGLDAETAHYYNIRPVSKKAGVTYMGIPSIIRTCTTLTVPEEPEEEKPSPEKPSPIPNMSEFEYEVLRLTNIEREKAGVAPLQVREDMQMIAKVRVKELITHFSHGRPDGSGYWTVFQDYNVKLAQRGEIIATCSSYPKDYVKGWMNSPGHKAYLLSPNAKYVGIAFINTEDADYCIEIFANDYATSG